MDPDTINVVKSPDSPEFTHLAHSLTRSSLIALDAEWKPTRLTTTSTFPTVTLLQLACQLADSVAVFLLDLLELPLEPVYRLLRDVFVSRDVLKLGFRFKQDLVYLNFTFCEGGCLPGFDLVEPYLDVMTMYNFLKNKQPGKKTKDIKSLAAICLEVLGYPLSKELQCSDWSHRPLTNEQIVYAAKDAHCLLDIFSIFQTKVIKDGMYVNGISDSSSSSANVGLKGVLIESDVSDNISRKILIDGSDVLRATAALECLGRIVKTKDVAFKEPCKNSLPIDETLLVILRNYSERILLKESDRKPRTSRRKKKKRSSVAAINREKVFENHDDWQGIPPWDLSLGGDECPKFLCDVMVEGLAKHLRCVGIDAAVPSSRKPEARELIHQAEREKRILLTRDAKLLRHDYLLNNQIYRVKSLLKNEQLLEVIETFKLEISEDKLMSRCTKCNGRFIQKPLTTEEAIEAAKGFQRIPSCLFDKNLEFWQCMECHQLYWEGTQYHNAVQKFINVCRLKE